MRPLGICRTTFYVSKMVMCAVLVVFSLRGRAQSSVMMEKETCAFLQSLPAGLQKTQADAVRRAINGDCTALISVRNSRNTKPESKSGVVATDIGGCYRLYRPAGFDTIPLPVLIYLHGGGWCFGSINSCAHFCAGLSYRAKIAVLAVEYPLAPEHAYPAALNACTEAVAFAFEHAGEYGFFPDRISIGGDSSGGNLALATALNLILAKDSHSCRMDSGTKCSSLCSLVLFYPVTKAWADGSSSWKNYAEGYGLDAQLMEAFNAAYIGTGDARQPLVSPGVADDELLKQIPPTLIVNAERDILLCQGKELAARLSGLGVAVSHTVLPHTVHLFITVPGQPAAFGESVRLAADFLTLE